MILPDELKIQDQAKGTRIICGREAIRRRTAFDTLRGIAFNHGFNEIILPTIEAVQVYHDRDSLDKLRPNKLGTENTAQMYLFPDQAGRLLCLRPEGTATIQKIADEHLNGRGKNIKLWYFERCYRYERPQAGRYREFWQFGMEVINPDNADQWKLRLLEIACEMVYVFSKEYDIATQVKRGLDYYVEDGFEISCPALGAQKQVCGGGRYPQGIGFALGFDRLMLLLPNP